jgi:sterol 24-C-methyltransferase
MLLTLLSGVGLLAVAYFWFFRKSEGVGITAIYAGDKGAAAQRVNEYQNFFAHKAQGILKEGQTEGGAEAGEGVDKRKDNYATVVNAYYDLATDFYEYGWGESFHFAVRHRNETLRESIRRHEHYLATQMGLQKGMKTLDVGCGVGGPMQEICRFSGAHIIGLNNNAYQCFRGQRHLKREALEDVCGFVKGDFMKMPFENESFDASYTIEACCHAPDRVGVFSEVFRVLKPGGVFAGYEWVMTDKYDPKNAEHVAIKKGIELGNGLPDLAPSPADVINALKQAGFEILKAEDRASIENRTDIPWYDPLAGRMSLSNFRTTKAGQLLTHSMLTVLETLRIVPKGACQTHLVLAEGARRLVKGGEIGVFTPMYLFVARKPEKSS